MPFSGFKVPGPADPASLPIRPSPSHFKPSRAGVVAHPPDHPQIQSNPLLMEGLFEGVGGGSSLEYQVGGIWEM
ncbi:hypothetical protein IFR05_008874 [Cadophora sp. M221]|nr:hypothetical protein IFR05_008874 [Cadophora sp. M221]